TGQKEGGGDAGGEVDGSPAAPARGGRVVREGQEVGDGQEEQGEQDRAAGGAGDGIDAALNRAGDEAEEQDDDGQCQQSADQDDRAFARCPAGEVGDEAGDRLIEDGGRPDDQ